MFSLMLAKLTSSNSIILVLAQLKTNDSFSLMLSQLKRNSSFSMMLAQGKSNTGTMAKLKPPTQQNYVISLRVIMIFFLSDRYMDPWVFNLKLHERMKIAESKKMINESEQNNSFPDSKQKTDIKAKV